MISDRIMMYSLSDTTGLCSSYMRAAKALGFETKFFDYEATTKKYLPFGKWGVKAHFHLDIQSVHHKVNREFVIQVKEYQPTSIFFFTNAPVTAGALLFIKSILPDCKLILVWPDSMLNVKQATFENLPLFDGIASYSEEGAKVFGQVTKAKVLFIPLAGDLDLHQQAPVEISHVDLGFVGGWRPERERCMMWAIKHFGQYNIEIHGSGWKDRTRKTPLEKYVRSPGKHGKDMAAFFNSTRINLNIIDDTNYPAANMRFFEIPTAGGLQLSSSCPEMESEFADEREILYFTTEDVFAKKIKFAIGNPDAVQQIKINAYRKITESHNYRNRLTSILNHLS